MMNSRLKMLRCCHITGMGSCTRVFCLFDIGLCMRQHGRSLTLSIVFQCIPLRLHLPVLLRPMPAMLSFRSGRSLLSIGSVLLGVAKLMFLQERHQFGCQKAGTSAMVAFDKLLNMGNHGDKRPCLLLINRGC